MNRRPIAFIMNNKPHTLVLVAFIWASSLSAGVGGKLSGSVTDQDGQSLAGTNIIVDDYIIFDGGVRVILALDAAISAVAYDCIIFY